MQPQTTLPTLAPNYHATLQLTARRSRSFEHRERRISAFAERRIATGFLPSLATDVNFDLTRLRFFARRQPYGQHAIPVLGSDFCGIDR